MKISRIILSAALSLLVSCSSEPTLDMLGMIDGQSPDAGVRFSGKQGVIMVKDSGPRVVNSPSDDYKVYVSTDMHIDSDAPTTHTDAFLKAFTDDPGSPMAIILGDLLKDAPGRGYRHIVVYTHTHMFKKDGSQGHTSNYPLEETWELTSMFARYGVSLFLSGHSHSRDISYFNGVKYIVVDALEEHYPDSQTGYMILEAGSTLDCRFFRFDGK